MIRYPRTVWLCLALSLALYGCGGHKSGDVRPPEPKPTPSEIAEAAQAQFQQRIAAAQSVNSEMACRELERSNGEPKAFFGFFWDACLDAFSKPFVYVTGFDYLRGRSPSEAAGLQIGDRVIGLNGCFVETREYFERKLDNFTATNMATIKVIRGPNNNQEVVSLSTEKLDKRSEGKRKRCEDIKLQRAP